MKKHAILAIIMLCCSLAFSGCGAGNKFYEKGIELAEKGDYQKAAEYMEKAMKENKERAEYYIGYGMVLNSLGEYEKAVEQFECAYQNTKNSIANVNNKQVFYGEAISYYYLSEYDKSLEYCDKALKLTEPESMDGDILCSKGAVLETTGELEQALDAYGQAIKKDSKNWQAYLKRASLEERINQPEDAKTDYQKVIQSDGEERYEACFKMYELCQTQGETDTAEQILKEIVETKSKDSFVTLQIGWAYHYQGDDSKAKEYLEKSQKDGYAEAGYYLGMLAMAEKDYTEAQKLFETYLSSGQGKLQAVTYNQLAGCAIEAGNLDVAQAYLEDGLKIADSSIRVSLWKNQIILLEKQGEFTQAKRAVKEYLAMYPQDQAMQKELEFIKTRKKKKAAKQKDTVQADTAQNDVEQNKAETAVQGKNETRVQETQKPESTAQGTGGTSSPVPKATAGEKNETQESTVSGSAEPESTMQETTTQETIP